MSELVKEFWQVCHYDRCLHGCNRHNWLGLIPDQCTCPIGKPFIKKESLIKRHLFESYGIPYNPNGMPREKVLEILNEWNNSGARAGVNGEVHCTGNSETGEFTKVITQYPIRRVYFLDPPVWLEEAKTSSFKKACIRYDENKEREAKDFAKYGMSIAQIYHEQLEGFIVPFEICINAPHYVDQIPKDSDLVEDRDWGNPRYKCPDCKEEFVLVRDWKNWKRGNTQ